MHLAIIFLWDTAARLQIGVSASSEPFQQVSRGCLSRVTAPASQHSPSREKVSPNVRARPTHANAVHHESCKTEKQFTIARPLFWCWCWPTGVQPFAHETHAPGTLPCVTVVAENALAKHTQRARTTSSSAERPSPPSLSEIFWKRASQSALITLYPHFHSRAHTSPHLHTCDARTPRRCRRRFHNRNARHAHHTKYMRTDWVGWRAHLTPRKSEKNCCGLITFGVPCAWLCSVCL
jgi:hypothetical protein